MFVLLLSDSGLDACTIFSASVLLTEAVCALVLSYSPVNARSVVSDVIRGQMMPTHSGWRKLFFLFVTWDNVSQALIPLLH